MNITPSQKHLEAVKALKCLYIAVDECVADDVNNKIRAALLELLSEREEAREMLSAIWGNCKVTYWPKDGGYPLEHTMGANKNMRREIEAELKTLMPPQ